MLFTPEPRFFSIQLRQSVKEPNITKMTDEKQRFLELLSSDVSRDPSEKSKTVDRTQAASSSPSVSERATLGPFGMPSSWIVPAEGSRRWFKGERDKRTFLIPIAHVEPLRINRISYRTTSPLVVTAVALSSDSTGQARHFEAMSRDSSGSSIATLVFRGVNRLTSASISGHVP